MNHLLSGLLRFGDPALMTSVLLEAIIGGTVAMRLLRDSPARSATTLRSLGFGVVLTITAWSVFLTVLFRTYSSLSVGVPVRWACGALFVALLSTGMAALAHLVSRRSARSAMLSGSLAASGISSMLFTAMAGVVRPFALAYDLTGVLTTVVIGGALFGYAFWEGSSAQQRAPLLTSIGLASAAVAIICLGSLASILPFEGWMTAMAEPDDLSAAPLVIIIASEAATVLVLGLFGSLVDNRAAARDRLAVERLRELASSTFEAIVIHRGGTILDGNEMLANLTGFSLPALIGKPLLELCHSDRPSQVTAARLADPLSMEVRTISGQLVPVEVLSRPITYAGNPAFVTALRDVRERRASEARIAFLAHHDVLTKLPNRAFLMETIERELHRCSQAGSSFSLLCLDLDGFKAVNDTLGHAAGDALLCEVASRLRAHMRPGDFVARLGGDEFVVLHGAAVDATRMAQGLVETIAQPFQIEGRHVRIGTSIGIGTFPNDGADAEMLLRNADVALYSSKERGRGTFCTFQPDMGKITQQRAEMQQELQSAVHRDELSLDFQPIFSRKGELIGFEALMRWKHPKLGIISPGDFIPLAEKTDLIVTLGSWALLKACAAAAKWPKPYRVAVNVSPRQLVRNDLAQEVARTLLQTGLPASRLELEITETALVVNDPTTLISMQELSRLGVGLALDDFGTGFSSLSYLHRFPFTKLKIDRSFTQRLPHDTSARQIVRAIVSMAHGLELKVTAEGVETQEQLDSLRAKGCQEFQGFYFSRPLVQSCLLDFITQHSTAAATDGKVIRLPC